MIYVLATPGCSYDFAHSEAFIGAQLAAGFIEHGREAVALWDGPPDVQRGVRHMPFESARPGPHDVVFAAIPQLAIRMAEGEWPALQKAGQKWAYTFCHQPEEDARFATFDRLFTDSTVVLEQLRAVHPRVHWIMAGVPDEIVSGVSPYQPGKHLFFAGRIARAETIELFADVLNRLPGYHLWYATTMVQLPKELADDELLGPWAGRFCFSSSETPTEPLWSTETGDLWCEKGSFRAVADKVFGHSRAHSLGPLAFGTFWPWVQHATAYLDHGFPSSGPAINCKIMDPLRAGCPIVADGYSPSYYLIDKHSAGRVVPFMDAAAMADAVEEIAAVDDPTERAARGRRVARDESWTARAAEILTITG